MADNILRLKVESSEYDAKLKKAAEGIRHLADVAHKSGGELTGLEKAELDYIKAMGEMETKSRTAAGRVRELENAFKELTVIYNNLNDVEKADEGGKALAASLEQIKQRAQEAKAQLDTASKSLTENGQQAQKSSGMLDALASKFTINIDALKLFDIGLQATKAALDVAKDAFFASEATVDEWGRTMQSAQGLYEGFLNAINTGDISGYLSRMDEIVRAARAAYDEMDKLNTMKTIQAPGISKQQLENDRFRMMIQTGRYISPRDGRANAVWNGQRMKEGQLLTPEQIKTLERQLQGGLQKMTDLVGNEVKQSGKAIDAYYNSLAKQNGMSLQEFKKGTSTWEEFSEKIRGYEEYKRWDREARAEFARQGGQGSVNFDKSNPFAEFKKWGIFRVDKIGENSYNELVGYIKQRDQQIAQMYGNISQSFRAINRAEGITTRSIMGGGSGGGRGGGSDTTKTLTELQENQKKINELTQQYVDIMGAAAKAGSPLNDEQKKQTEEIQNQIKQLEKRNGLLNLYASRAKGLFLPNAGDFDKNVGKFEVNPFAADNRNMANYGTIKLVLDDKSLKAVNDQISSSLRKSTNNNPYLRVNENGKTEASMNGVVSGIAGGISQMTSSLEQLGIEIPEGIKGAINAIQGVTSILSSIMTIVLGIQALATADVVKIFSHGGIVPTFANGGLIGKAAGGMLIPGNSFSGDNLRLPVDGGRGMIGVNSGELILSRSQQGVIANELERNGSGGGYTPSHVTGEQIWIALNAYTRRIGQGEVMTWR